MLDLELGFRFLNPPIGRMKIGIISDTHGHLDDQVFDYFKECDEIWHAGDIGDLSVTDRLKEFKQLKFLKSVGNG